MNNSKENLASNLGTKTDVKGGEGNTAVYSLLLLPEDQRCDG